VLVSQLSSVTCLGWQSVTVHSLWMSISSQMNNPYSLSFDVVQSPVTAYNWSWTVQWEVMLMKNHHSHFNRGLTISIPKEALSTHVLPKVHLTPLVHIYPCIHATSLSYPIHLRFSSKFLDPRSNQIWSTDSFHIRYKKLLNPYPVYIMLITAYFLHLVYSPFWYLGYTYFQPAFDL